MNNHNSIRDFRVGRPKVDIEGILPTTVEMDGYLRSKYGEVQAMGSSPRLRYKHGYVASDDVYECLVSKIITKGDEWADVGCGRDIFPSNYTGASEIASRASRVVGIDPSENVQENDLLTEKFQGLIEHYCTDNKFDVITMRMVAEHIVDAQGCVRTLAQLTKVGGQVVIYTPWKWAPMSIVASLVPFTWHNRLKRMIWDSEDQDTFPTAYRMNTRKDLAVLFNRFGFEESFFAHVDDCSVTARYLRLNSIEMWLQRAFDKARISYPENCLLAVYKKL